MADISTTVNNPDDLVDNVKKANAQQANEVGKLAKDVEKKAKKGISSPEALEKAIEIIDEGFTETSRYFKLMLEEAGKQDASEGIKNIGTLIKDLNDKREIIAKDLASAIKDNENAKKNTEKELEDLIESYEDASEEQQKEYDKKIAECKKKIAENEEKKQKAIKKAQSEIITLTTNIKKRIDQDSKLWITNLESQRKKSIEEFDELSHKMQTASKDLFDAVEKYVLKKSPQKSNDDDEGVENWKKKLNSIIEEDAFAGRAVKAFYMAKNAKKKGGSIAGGLLSAFKGDVHRSFQKWAYGGSGITGVAKALLGKYVDSKLEKRANKKLENAFKQSENEVKRLQTAYKSLAGKPGVSADAVASERLKYNQALRRLLLLRADVETHGRNSLIEMDSGLMKTSDEAQTLGKRGSDLLASLNKSIAEDEKTLLKAKGPAPKNVQAEQMPVGSVLKKRLPALLTGRPKLMPSQMTVDITAEEVPQGRNIGSHAGGALLAIRGGIALMRNMRAMRDAGMFVKGTPGGTKIRTLAGNFARVGENSRSEAVVPMQGKVPAMIGRTIAAAAGFGQKGTSSGGRMQYESAADHEMKQKEMEDRHSIAEDVAIIADILQREEKEKKKPEKSFFQKIIDAIMSLGAIFGPALAKIARFIKGISAFLKGGKLFKSLAGLFGKAGIFGKIGKFFSSIFGKGGKIAGFLGKIGKFFAPITKLFSKGGFLGVLGKAFKGLAPLFKVLGPIIKTIAPFFKLLGKLFLPLQAILTGLDAFKGWTDKDLHKRLFGLQEGEEATTGQKYQATLSSILSGLTGGLISTEAIHKFLSDGFTGIFYNGLGKLIDFACDFFNAEDKWEFIKEKAGAIKDAIFEGLGRIGDWISETWTNAKEWVVEKISGLWEGITNCFSSIGEWISEKAGAAWEWIKENNPITLIWNGLESIGTWVSEKASAAWEWIKENNPISLLQTGFENIGKWVSEKANAVWEFVKENNPFTLISNAFEDIKKWLEEHNPFEVIEDFFEGISKKFKELNPFSGWFDDDEEEEKKKKEKERRDAEREAKARDAKLSPEARQAKQRADEMRKRRAIQDYAAKGGVDWNGKPIATLEPVYNPTKTAMPSMSPIVASIAGGIGQLGGSGPVKAPIIDTSKIGGLSKEGAFSLERSITSIDKNVESIYKMMRYIKVDGVMLGDLLDNKPGIAGVPGSGGGAGAGAGGPGGAGGFGAGGGAGGAGGGGMPPQGVIPQVSGGPAQLGADGFLSMSDMGSLAGKYESGGKSTTTVDNGDNAGTSFGKYQIAGVGRRKEFLSFISKMGGEGAQIAQQLAAAGFVNSTGNNSQSAQLWKQLANAGKIQQYEDAFGKADYFGTAFNGIKSEKAKEMIKNSPTLQKALFSYSLQGQHGAYQGINRDFKEGMTEQDLLLLMYNDRLNRAERNQNNHKKGLIKGLRNRLGTGAGSERNLALGMLQAEQQAKANGTFKTPAASPSGGGGSVPASQPVVQQGGGGSVPVSNPNGEPTIHQEQAGGPSGPSSNLINFGNEAAQRSFDSLNPTFRGRMLGAAAEYMKRTGKKIRISGPRCSRRTINEQAGIAARNKPGYAAKASENAPHVQGLAVDVTSEDANALATMGILDQFGLSRPLWPGIKTSSGVFVKEAWHIEPKERRVGLAARSKDELLAQFGASPAYYGASGNDMSGSGLVGGPGMAAGQSPAGTSYPGSPGSGGSPQSSQPAASYGGPSGGSGGPMQQMPTPSGAPGIGAGSGAIPGGGQPAYGGGGLAGRVLGIAKKNASISGKGGYSQDNRLGANQFDCSSFVARSLKEAGYDVGNPADFTTRSMGGILKGLGFQWHSGLDGAQPGDIMWRPGHTEIYLGNGKTIGALNSKIGVGEHPVSWGKYTGYWRDGSIAQMSPEEAAAASGAPAIGGGGNIKDAMSGMEQPGMAGVGAPGAGPQIQNSQQSQVANQASAYYAAGGAGGNVNNQTNVFGGGGNADKSKTTFITTKDPMGWVVLQGNCVH